MSGWSSLRHGQALHTDCDWTVLNVVLMIWGLCDQSHDRHHARSHHWVRPGRGSTDGPQKGKEEGEKERGVGWDAVCKQHYNSDIHLCTGPDTVGLFSVYSSLHHKQHSLYSKVSIHTLLFSFAHSLMSRAVLCSVSCPWAPQYAEQFIT